MSRHGDKAREVLLDAAEELFATHGIDAVSNRKITEHAGTANHSAIKYHFGSRDGLLRALVERANQQMLVCQDRLEVDPDAEADSLRRTVTLRTMPWIYSFDSLPTPSWRSQFLFQARSHLNLPLVVEDGLREDLINQLEHTRPRNELEGIPEAVISARASILGTMSLVLCAEYERTVNEGKQQGDWESVGYFLVDSIMGMLCAPSTAPADFMDFKREKHDASS